MPNMKTVGQKNLKLLGGQAFSIKAPVTLTFDLKINRAYLLIMTYPMPNMKTVGQKNLKLFSRQTAGRPVGQTDKLIPV
jgi:hypothetical protein